MTLKRLPLVIAYLLTMILLATQLAQAQEDSTGKETTQDCSYPPCMGTGFINGHFANTNFISLDSGNYISNTNLCAWVEALSYYHPIVFHPNETTTINEGGGNIFTPASNPFHCGSTDIYPHSGATDQRYIGLHYGYNSSGTGHWNCEGISQEFKTVPYGTFQYGHKYFISYWARVATNDYWASVPAVVSFLTTQGPAPALSTNPDGTITSGFHNILSQVITNAASNYNATGNFFLIPADGQWHHIEATFICANNDGLLGDEEIYVVTTPYMPSNVSGVTPSTYKSLVLFDDLDIGIFDNFSLPSFPNDTSVCSGACINYHIYDSTYQSGSDDSLFYHYVDGTGTHYVREDLGATNQSFDISFCPITSTTVLYLDSMQTHNCPSGSLPLNDSVTINVYPQPNITTSGFDTACNGGGYMIPLMGTFTPGVTQIYYTRTPGGSMTATAATGGFLSGPLTPGTYVYQLDSATSGYCGGTASGTFTLTVLPDPSGAFNTSACIGDSITITGTPNTMVEYLHLPSGSPSYIQLDNSGNAKVPNYAGVGTQTYVVIGAYYIGAHACNVSYSDTFVVNILATPTATLTPDGHHDYCSGSIVPIGITGAATWANIVVDGQPPISVTVPWTYALPLNPGPGPVTHTIVLQQGFNLGCSVDIYDTLFATVWPEPSEFFSSDQTICSGDAWSTFVINGTPNTTVTYTINGVSYFINVPYTGTVNPPLPSNINTGGTPLVYTYVITNATLTNSPYCSNNHTDTAVLTVNPVPTVTVTEAPILCWAPGDSLHATGADTYQWSPATGLSCSTCATTGVTVTTATTYTVTGTNTYGCSSQATVTVDPIPVITFLNYGPGTDTLCLGSSTNLYAFGALNYTWNPMSSLTCTSPGCESVLATPTVTTTYTVTGTDLYGCLDSGTYTLTVDTLPVLDTFLLTGPQTVCNGTSTSVYFVGTPNTVVSGNINGYPATFPLDPTGHYTLTVTPTVTTTINIFSIAYPFPPYCTQPANGNIEIDVLPVATVNFNPNAATFCPGQNSDGLNSYPLTPNVTNVFTFNWTSTPFDPTLNPTTLYPTVTPTVTTTYYLTVWANDTCPPATDSFKLVVPTEQCVCSIFCGAVPQPLGAFGVIDADVPPGNYYIPNNAVVKGGVIHFDQAIVDIANNVTVTVDSASVLELRSSHLFDCDSMWNGIVLHTSNDPGVPTTGHVVFTKGNLVEDADTAVFTDGAYKLPIFNSTAPPSIEQYVIYSDDAIFNSNLYGIGIQNIHDSGSAFYPFLIRNTVFTSRKMNVGGVGPNCTDNYPYYWPPTMGTGGLKNNWTAPTPYDPPYSIDNPNGSVIGSAFNLQVCHNGSFPYAGIMLRDIGWHHSNNYYGVWIGDENINQYGPGNPTENLFDHVSSGISAYNANFLLHNAAYIHMYQTLSSTMGIVTGNGVYAINTDGGKHSMEMDGIISSFMPNLANRFYDCISGVYSLEYYRTKMWYAEMYSPQQVGMPTPNGTGRFGFYGQSSLYRRVDLQKNIINNVTDGIVFISTYASGTNSTINTYAGVVDISDNDVSADMSGAPITPTRFMQQAIYVANGVNQTTPIINTTKINNNSIRDVYNGIYVANFLPTVVTDSNSVSLVLDPSGLSQAGIEHAKCSGDYISSNSVIGPGMNTPIVSPFTYTGQIISGIYGTNNTGFTFGCNTVSALNSGFEFFDNYNTGKWIKNEMANNMFDYVLNNAVIGNQLSTTHVCDNFWDPYGGSVYNTFVVSPTPPTTSVLYCNGTISNGMVPGLGLNGSIPTPNNYSQTSTPPTIIGIDPSAPLAACDTSDDYPPGFELLFRAARMHMDYQGQYIKRSSWMAQQALYEQIHADTTLADSSTVLQQFKAMAANSRYHYLHCIEDKLTQGDYIGASTMLNAPIDTMATTDSDLVTGVTMADDTAADVVVAHYKLFYSLYLKYKQHMMNGNDSSQLLALASMCPPIDGAVVYQARVLYALTTHDFHRFSDNGCDSSKTDTMHHNEARQASTGTTVLADVDGQEYSLYPNPSRGDVFVQQQVADEAPVNAIVLNDAGQLMYKGIMSFKDKKEHLHYDNLLTGLYLMQLTDSKGRVFTLKFTVEK